ncbi:MAG: photosystem reaction center subunit [Verrucomicrobiales bacterium]|nr:photosystem reaction center subunit [Verrucomicrobiales bacterium]
MKNNANKWIALGAMAALTSITSLRADNTAQVQVDTDHPRVETKVRTDRDATVRTDAELRTEREVKARLHNKASDFLGMEVKNNNNEKLGEVKDMVLDPQSGRVQYVVLAVGGFLGIGEKLLAVPYTSLRPSTENHKLVMNASRERIAQAPGFAATNWPDVRDPNWDGATFWNELNESNRGNGAVHESGYDRSGTTKRYGDRRERLTPGDKKVEVETHVDTK